MKIIFIPGLICTDQIWGKLNNIRTQYQCHNADTTQHDSIEKISDNIIKQLPGDEIAIIGISMGGYIAIDMALKMDKKLKKLILINTTSYPVNPATINDRLKGIQLARNGKLDNIIEMNTGCCYFKPKNKWIALEKTMANQLGSEAYINQQTAIITRRNYSKLITNIQSETLIISGKNDVIIPYQDSIYLFENIKNSTLTVLNECGHLSTLEKGSLILNVVTHFLNQPI
jgi:pimeloyl-ACP methyl ester carboxylesterase